MQSGTCFFSPTFKLPKQAQFSIVLKKLNLRFDLKFNWHCFVALKIPMLSSQFLSFSSSLFISHGQGFQIKLAATRAPASAIWSIAGYFQ